jgi:hypothetical protein
MPRNRIVVRLAISLSCLMAMLLGAGVLGLFRTESINHERQSNVAKQRGKAIVRRCDFACGAQLFVR